MDEELLAPFGLTSSEIVVYQAVLASGGIEPAALAKAANVKRTTAYSIARSLVEKGLLVEDATRRPRIITVSTPEQVLERAKEEERRIAEREKQLVAFARELANVSAKASYPVPTIRFIEESKISSFFKQRLPEWNRSLLETDPTWWGFQDHTYVDHYQENIDFYWKNAPKEIDLKLLSNLSTTERQISGKYPRRHIKFWGEATNFISTTWVIGDYLVMINTQTHPFYLVEIHDKRMAHDQREVFRNLWEMV